MLAPHGSICVELGDTYAGSGGAGGDYDEDGLRSGQQKFTGSARRDRIPVPRNLTGGPGWPLPKSLCGIPHLYHLSLAYGRNLLTGEASPAGQWRVRNVVAWCRPNPPVGALGDKFRPATSYMTVATVARDRYFDLDAVRTEPTGVNYGRQEGWNNVDPKAGSNRREAGTYQPYSHPGGAPPLDWWEIPTQASTGAGSGRLLRVPVDAAGGGIRRTTSPSCPVHGSPDHQGSSAPDGERAGSESSRNARTDGRPARGPDAAIHATPLSLDLTGSSSEPQDPARSPAATPRSIASRRTGPAHATSPAGTPSAQTSAGTGDTSTSPESSAPHPDTPSSSTAEACPPAAEPGTKPRTAHTSDPSSACSCSYYVEALIPQDTSNYATWPDDYWVIPTQAFSGSHYATWPSALCERPIKAMCPQRVCLTCGEPSRRIVDVEHVANRSTNGPQSTDRKHLDGGSAGYEKRADRRSTTTGWTDCGCSSDGSHWRTGIVLDPFAGSGTTLAVATGHGRDAIGIDIDSRNADLARERVGLFLTVETPEQEPAA